MQVRLGLFLLLLLTTGCAWGKRPYANDPLVKHRRAVVGNPVACEPVEKWERPCPPPPPPEGR